MIRILCTITLCLSIGAGTADIADAIRAYTARLDGIEAKLDASQALSATLNTVRAAVPVSALAKMPDRGSK